MASPVNNSIELTSFTKPTYAQAEAPIVHIPRDMLAPILTRLKIEEAVAFLSSCRFTLLTHFENKDLWTQLFNSRFPLRTIPQELGPLGAYKDVLRCRQNLRQGNYTTFYSTPPFVPLSNLDGQNENKTYEGKIFQLINPSTMNVMDLETGATSLWTLEQTVLNPADEQVLERESVDSFTFADGKLITRSTDRCIKQWDIQTRQCLSSFNTPEDWRFSLVISGGRILSFQADNTLRIYNALTLECLHTLNTTSVNLQSIACTYATHDKLIIATGLHAGTHAIQIADLKENRWLPSLRGHIGTVLSLAAHGDTLVSGGMDGRIWVWNISTGESVRQINAGIEGEIVGIPFSLAINEGVVFAGTLDIVEDGVADFKVYDLETGQLLSCIESMANPRRGFIDPVRAQSFADWQLMMEDGGRRMEVRNYHASTTAVLKELAQRLKFEDIDPEHMTDIISIHVMILLSRLGRIPQKERHAISLEFFELLTDEQKKKIPMEVYGSPQEAFVAYLNSMFLAQKPPGTGWAVRAQAIENYLAKEAALTGAQNQ